MGIDFAKILDSLSGKNLAGSAGEGFRESDFSKNQLDILKQIFVQMKGEKLQESGKICPECGNNFNILNIKGTDIDFCIFCRSIWFDSGELKTFTEYASDVPSEHLKHRKSRYSCPVCNMEMNEYVFKAPGNVLVDQCPERHGVYLESGELARIFKSANIKLKN